MWLYNVFIAACYLPFGLCWTFYTCKYSTTSKFIHSTAQQSTAANQEVVADTSEPITNYTLGQFSNIHIACKPSLACIHPNFHHKNYLRNKMVRINMKLIFRERPDLNYNGKMWKSLQYAKRQKAIKIILWLCYCQFISRNMLSAFFRPIFCFLVLALPIFHLQFNRLTVETIKMKRERENKKTDTTFYELLRGPHATWWCDFVCGTKAERRKKTRYGQLSQKFVAKQWKVAWLH